MKQALEALEEWEKPMSKGALEAHRILRTAIAEAESVEPVAWMFVNSDGECEQIEYGAFDMDDQSSITLLYTTPPAQTAPVPSSWVETVAVNLVREGINKHKARELAAHFYGLAQQPAAQRQWVDLTDDEIDDADCVELEYIGSGDYVVNGESVYKFAIAIGARLKEKNT